MRVEHKETLNNYAEIKSKIKELEAKADELNPLVLDIMQELEVEEIELGDTGKLSMGERRTWKYPSFIQEKEKELKEEKKKAEQTGSADYTTKKYVIFKVKSEEKENY